MKLDMRHSTVPAMALTLAIASFCHATEYKTKDSFVSATYWVQATNWTDMAGNYVDLPPTNQNDSAYLTGSNVSASGKRNLRSITFANTAYIKTGGGSCKRVEVGRIYSDYMMLLQFGTQLGNAFPAQTFSVADPDGFSGFWSSYCGFGNVELRATADHSPALSHYDICGYMGITVPEAGTSATVESLFRSGALIKRGEGDLLVKAGAGTDSRIFCESGTVALAGLSDATYSGSIPKAWLHLDATRTDTMTTFQKDGRECLARWNDCDGGAVFMTTNFPAERLGRDGMVPFVHPPYVATTKSPSGKSLVDFGLTDLDITGGEPSNCLMVASETLLSAKEFFFAAKATSNVSSRRSRAIVGALGYRQYMGYGDKWILDTYSCNSTLISSRHITFNGMAAHPLWGEGSPAKTFKTRHGANPGDFSVIGFGSEAAMKFDMIGSDGGYVASTGGWQLGELLVYDRVLTDDERRKVNLYLMEKWQKDFRPNEVGELIVNDDSAVSVPAGRTARVKSLSTIGSKIVKKGAGRLIVDGVAPAGVKLDIQDGSLTVETPTVVEEPAANPYFWIDATNTASLVMAADNEQGGTQYITRWNDCNGGSVYAELPLDEDPIGEGKGNVYLTSDNFKGHKPWVAKAVSPTGLDMIDFGALYVSPVTQSFMQLVPHGSANAYCGFIVVKAYGAGWAQQYFGTSNTDFLQLNAKGLYHSSASRDALASAWTIDGRAVDTSANISSIIANTDCHVVAFACQTAKLRADLLCKYRYEQDCDAGSQKIGEMILYDRILTDEERRNTEAYLMKKWLGKDHPESAAGFSATYKYPANKPVVVDTDADVTIDAEGGNGELVKRGDGTVTFGNLATVSNYVSFAAEGGSLTVKLDLEDDAFYRYDASDLDSFTSTYLTDDGEGGQVTNILKWSDQVSGRLATSAHIDGFSPKYGGLSGGSCTNPTLKAVAMPDGVKRLTVDFGEYNNVAYLWGKDTSSPVPLGTINSSSGMLLYDYSNTGTYGFMEMHTIYADRPKDDGSGLDNRMMIFTAKSTNPIVKGGNEEALWRGSSGALFKGKSFDKSGNLVLGSDFVSEGVIHKDGVAVSNTETLGSGFHLVSIQPTNKVNCSAISLDRNCNAGGCYISEVVAYKERHSPEVFAYIEGKLMRKWFGTAASRAPWVRQLTALTAEEGATLTIDTEASVVATELAGAGTIAAPEIGGVASISLTDAGKTLEATGTVTLADIGVVSISKSLAGVASGNYTVFSAGSLANSEALLNWTLDVEVPGNRSASLAVDGNDIVLKVETAGLIIMVR